MEKVYRLLTHNPVNNILTRLSYYFDRVYEKWLLFKFRNKPYRQYYRAVMKKETARDFHWAVGGDWDTGADQLCRLRMHGLLPSHTLLDFGCGSLRGGRHFIKFLNPSHYFGADISPDIISAGKQVLTQDGLAEKTPSLTVIEDLSFKEFAGMKFDFIHAQSVLSHMPPEDIEELFANVSKVMTTHSKFFATFFESDNGKIFPTVSKKNFYYPFSTFRDLASKYGLHVEKAQDTPGTGKQKLVLITLEG